MEIIYDVFIVVTGIAIYKIIRAIIDVIFKISQRVKSGVPRMDNPPPPPKRKSFKERLLDKQKETRT